MSGWDATAWQVQRGSKNKATAHGSDTVLLLAYDRERNADRNSGRDYDICNVSRQDGSVCRMPRGHEGLHVAFSGELIAITGIYILDRIEA